MLKNQWHLIELLYKIYKLHTLDLKFIDITSLANVCYLPYNLQVIEYFVLAFIPSTCQVLVVTMFLQIVFCCLHIFFCASITYIRGAYTTTILNGGNVFRTVIITHNAFPFLCILLDNMYAPWDNILMGRMGRYGQCSYAQFHVACSSYSDFNVFKITHILFWIK